ncbi:CAAX farnesyltransferase (FTase) subunit beta [Coemansia sp. RSA 1722]|nr:CAAX farnesyltransferase (FTase) subunit beta [Coemansia sp. RSA 486]KAJ2237514.1 CAAX farnesyltransferase (FTase) subunit beta [Coemansia sp. RSA 485]KAJ2598939.1 CAAX farnesyltransferase (FTase) subunit beta [Coemansia sp. RSA 1721]KAJ2605058.1 CAAX farnesyltransferase (FTase) subunit beta [Coemansia sp. RSA 1722]KAJ2637448.1 CAAX farnesyltransferase (FTase) subunit beta [Coemansia sp. RSA 1286]
MSHLFSYDFRYDDNGYETETSAKQQDVEDSIGDVYVDLIDPSTLKHGGDIDDSQHRLQTKKHQQYIMSMMDGLPGGFKVLDASQPWFSLWCLNSLSILGSDIDDELRNRAIETLRPLQDPRGGFCGGNKQLPHLAGSFAAVMTVAIVGGETAYRMVDRQKMYQWLMTMKNADGSFSMHKDGETDVRGVYCALVIASLLNIMTPELTENTANFISLCQTCEGGIGPFPGVEAHGGYTLCGMAALEILDQTDKVDLTRLARWMAARQMAFEGGFNGRTNKLVDGCYSYWVGGAFPLLQKALGRNAKDDYLYDRAALQRYVLACCQDLTKNTGGLRDKPGKSPDLYHTMYCLAGLSLAQHYVGVDSDKMQKLAGDKSSVYSVPMRMMQWDVDPKCDLILGVQSNKVVPVHPVYSIPFKPLASCIKHFYSLAPLDKSFM